MTDKTTPTVSISIVETRDVKPALRAVLSTLDNTPATSVYWFSNQRPPEEIPVPTHWIRIRDLDTPDNLNYWYSEITLKTAPSVVNTDYNIMIQSDGFAVNRDAWTDEFYHYDYIGAPWLWWEAFENVGNGGFSWRSRRFYDALIDWNPGYRLEDWPTLPPKYHNPGTRLGFNEDNLIAGPFRPILEHRYGLRYAPIELAHQWSIEGRQSWGSPWFKRSLGFHGREIAPHYGIEL